MLLPGLVQVLILSAAVSPAYVTDTSPNVFDWTNYFKHLNEDSVGTRLDYSNFVSSHLNKDGTGSIKHELDPSMSGPDFQNQPTTLQDHPGLHQSTKCSDKLCQIKSQPVALTEDRTKLTELPLDQKESIQYRPIEPLSLFRTAESTLNSAENKFFNTDLIAYGPVDSLVHLNLFRTADSTVDYGETKLLNQYQPFGSSTPTDVDQPSPNNSERDYINLSPILYNRPLEFQQFFELQSPLYLPAPYNYQNGPYDPSTPFNTGWKPTWWQGVPFRFAHPPAESKPHRPKLSTEKPVVTTDKGMVRGNKMTSRSGNDYYAFTSIPYAKPPIGQLRFERPVPADEWTDVKEGPEDLPECMQIQFLNPYLNNITYGTEDCLYLSVFTPQVNEDQKLPVMVYVLGGAYRSEFPTIGKAIRSKYIMDEDVVLVTFKYRTGAFGFLSLEDGILPGNMGLKDSALLLDWVSKNIHKFGGDPSRVTLFGNSVGASTVHYLLTSPMTKHLAHRGISQSGTANCLWALGVPGVGRYRASRLAEHLNCPTTPDKDLLECLKTKTAFEIADSEHIFVIRDFDPPIPYQPMVESGEDCFICGSPYNIPVEKPWMLGVTKNEGAMKLAWYIVEPELTKSFIEHGADFLPDGFMYMNTTTYAREISEAIMSKYQGIAGLSDMWTDGLFYSGAAAALKRVAVGPTYFYLLSHRGKTSIMDVLGKIGNISLGDLGVSHTDELFYLLNFEDDLKIVLPPEDVRVSKSFIKLWTNFAKYGRPTKKDEWPQYDQLYKQFLNIGSSSLSVESNLWPDRTEFWNNLPIRNVMEAYNL